MLLQLLKMTRFSKACKSEMFKQFNNLLFVQFKAKTLLFLSSRLIIGTLGATDP